MEDARSREGSFALQPGRLEASNSLNVRMGKTAVKHAKTINKRQSFVGGMASSGSQGLLKHMRSSRIYN